MRTTTTVLLAVGAATLAVPASASAAGAQSDIRVPLAGHLTVQDHMQAERTALAQQRLTRKAWRLARRLADERDEGFSPAKYRRRVGDDPPASIARRIRSLRTAIKREERKDRRRAAARRNATASPALEAIAACESGGNPGTNTGNGFYGKYQFTLSTWQSVGGSGNPAAASEAEQNKRAAILYAREGAAPWPVCGR